MIREARSGDVDDIKTLADSLAVHAGEAKRTGFYEFTLDRTQYARRVHSPDALVAESGDGLEGFCLAYDWRFLDHLFQQEPQAVQDPVYNFIARHPLPFTYVEQFAVRQDALNRGSVAIALRDEIVSRCKQSHGMLLCVTAIHPWRNDPAIRLAEGAGLCHMASIDTGKLTLGVYRLSF
jgi:hypothetical protein